MIWLLSHPLPLSRQQVVSLSQSYCVPPVELTDGREGYWGWGRSQIIQRQESMVLYNNHKILSDATLLSFYQINGCLEYGGSGVRTH